MGDYLRLKPSGSNLKGVCPFHDDTRPSLLVRPSTQTYKCFVCGAGGDVINFVAEYEKMGLGEALEWCAKRAGISLQHKKDPDEDKRSREREASNEGRDFLILAEPIKVGHHSEKRHRALIERNWARMGKSVEYADKASEHESKAEYWKRRAADINLSMPESIEYYEHELEEAREYHEGLKSGKYPREHSYSLTYAKKKVNELETKHAMAVRLWG